VPTPPGHAQHEVAESPGGLSRRFLRVPLFYKILLANSAIVLVGTIVGMAAARGVLREGVDFPTVWIVGLALAGVLVTLGVNAAILRIALTPLVLLEATAERVQAGDLDARVPYSPLSDPQLERLTGTFNGMLDNLASFRQRLSGIAARALKAEEQERLRISRELHDDTAQSLAALLIRLRLLRTIEDPTARDEALDEFRTEVGEALERIRRYARGLRPPALDELGLVPAVESHVRGLSESVGIPIRVEAVPLDSLLSHQAELALYRIAQEAISNAIRHSRPRRVLVRIERSGPSVSLTVSDDGTGFDPEEMMGEERGLGLFGMSERAGYVGGHLTIRSGPGEGTTVRAVIPITGRRDEVPVEDAPRKAVD
jgi:two-component system, NarL family, sensor histidine kinase UhpB